LRRYTRTLSRPHVTTCVCMCGGETIFFNLGP